MRLQKDPTRLSRVSSPQEGVLPLLQICLHVRPPRRGTKTGAISLFMAKSSSRTSGGHCFYPMDTCRLRAGIASSPQALLFPQASKSQPSGHDRQCGRSGPGAVGLGTWRGSGCSVPGGGSDPQEEGREAWGKAPKSKGILTSQAFPLWNSQLRKHYSNLIPVLLKHM